MLTKLCSRCKRVIPYGQTYCSTCQAKVDEDVTLDKRKRNQRYDKQRNKETTSFYQSKEWKALRSIKLARVGYMCEDCKAQSKISIADEVHHMEEVSNNWDRRLDFTNLKALCKKCHNKRHGRFC